MSSISLKMTSKLTGGCHCGAIRYEITAAKVKWTGYCHCRTCQHTTGAPIVPFFNVSPDEFRFTKGEPAIYRSSDHAGRSFCAVCSTQLIFRDDKRPEDVDIVTITLDDPNSGPQPALHVFCESQVKWFNVQDDLPRYQRMPSEDEKQNEKPATVINPVMHYD